MNAQNAYYTLSRVSPQALDAIERMIARGWSPVNAAHLLMRQYPTHVSRLIRPAALYAAQAKQQEVAA